MPDTLWEGRFLSIVREDGWEYARRKGTSGAVAIVAVHDGHLLLIEQHRVPAGRACTRQC